MFITPPPPRPVGNRLYKCLGCKALRVRQYTRLGLPPKCGGCKQEMVRA